MRITGAATALRAAGLKVVERPGWKTRDNGRELTRVRGLTVHHTAGSRNSSVEGELRVIERGRPGLPGPISQFMVARDGTWYCTAAGAANHNKVGTAGPNKGYGNSYLIGVECQHAGASEPWTDRQYDSLVAGVAALAKRYGFTTSTIAGHKEHQPGEKVDPSFSMNRFRSDVAQAMKPPPPPPTPPPAPQEDFMASIEELMNFNLGAHYGQPNQTFGGAVYTGLVRDGYLANVFAPAVLAALQAVGDGIAVTQQMIAAGEAADAAVAEDLRARIEAATAELRAAVAGIPEAVEAELADIDEPPAQQ